MLHRAMLVTAVILFTQRLAAVSYEVGPGLTYSTLGSVSWTSLNPGDTVNIHYQPGGYHEIIQLSNSGVSNAPVTINGIPDPATSTLPTLDGQNAVTATNTAWNDVSLNTAGIVVVSRAANRPHGYIPSWIVIQNIHVQNAAPTSALTQANGAATNFDSAAAAIYVEYAQHLVIRGCELSDSGTGFFCGSKNGDVSELSADVLIEHCWVHDNGYPGNFDASNLSTESKGIIFQYNRIGPLRPEADGYQIKDRSSGTILRYNQVIQNSGGFAFWFLQCQGGIGIIDHVPAYRTNYVYGNVFLNTPESRGQVMFVYDSLGIQGQPRNGTLFFYNNTVVSYADQSSRYSTELFLLPTHDEVQQWNVHDVLDCRNNIFATLPAAPGGAASFLTLLETDDSAMNLGTNWVTPDTEIVRLPYGATNFYGTVTGTNQLLFGDHDGLNNPGFVSVTDTNFHLLSSSPAIDMAGPQSPAVLSSPNNVTLEYVHPINYQTRAVNGRGLDLGAFEGTSTNFTGPLFTLTVSNGFGSGNYPTNAVVPIAASAAPAGLAFAGWTGYAMTDASSLGTWLVMPSSNISVTATFTNLPVPTNYQLTVVNGSGGDFYLPGTVVTITANTPPSGETFVGWGGYAVANSNAASTTLIMPAGDVTVFANYQVSSTFNLTIVNGSGGGVYAPGTVVNISANSPPAGKVFSGWSGYTVANAAASNTTLTMPAADVMVSATFHSTNGYSNTIPFPVASHPRLWITTNDLPRLRSWAVPSNPIYMAVRTLLTNSMVNYDTGYFPGGVQNTNWPDPGDSAGYDKYITEEDAFAFAFFSLIDPDLSARAIYAEHAANLIRVEMSEAAKSPLAGAPFRDPGFATYNRAFAQVYVMPLAVDWIYNAIGTNGQPVLSAADKRTIRDGFLNWAYHCRTAETAYGDSPIPDAYNDASVLLPHNAAYRMAANNYYLSHARLMTMLALVIDPQDDPPLNPGVPESSPTNSLRSYLSIATGAWLYQEYAMFGEGAQVADDYGMPGYGANFGLASGGMAPEGSLYGHSMGFVLGQLLAMQTAGFGTNTIDYTGPQIKLLGAPVWDRFCDAWLSIVTPLPATIASYEPPAYQPMGYGDMLRLFLTPDVSEAHSLLMLLDARTGVTNRTAKTRWLAMEEPQGGYAGLLNRVSNPYGGGSVNQHGVLYFLSIDPATLAPPADPRPALPSLFFDRPQGMFVAHSDWTTNASLLHWRCCWLSIDHQNGDGGMFQFYRKGEFLTKELSSYDQNAATGQSSWLHNTLALQNTCPAGTPGNLSWYEAACWTTGSQWMMDESAGDPVTLVSSDTNHVFTYGDLTPLYNRPSVYSPEDAALDIQHASRSLLWLKPDHLIVYDRATSHTAGLFKRFNLCLPDAPTVAAHNGGGSVLTETLPSGQRLFINSLLPATGAVSINSLSNAVTTAAEGDPCHYRLAIEDTNNPTNIRFLHVLQGADAGGMADTTTYAQSTGGNAFEGVVVHGVEVLFPVNVLSNNFTSVSYTAPAGVTNHYVAGLTPHAQYAVTVQTNGGQLLVTVTPGPQLTAEQSGLLVFDNAGHAIDFTLPQITGLVELDGFVGSNRTVTFKATDVSSLVLKTWNMPLAFAGGSTASYALTDVPLATVSLSAKTDWNLRRKLGVSFSNNGAVANFTGAHLLPAGDLDDSNVVDWTDYFTLASFWYTTASVADLDGNGLVDILDYFLLANHWHETGDPE